MVIDIRLVDSRRIPCLDESRHRELIAAIDRNRYAYEAELYLEGIEPIRRFSRPVFRMPSVANE